MSTMRTVLLTGANGFVGRSLTEDLLRRGYAVRRAVRIDDGVPDTVAVGPIDGATDWQVALQTVDAVIHLAGTAHRPIAYQIDNEAEYQAVNVDGTANLGRQSKHAGIDRIVFASTIGVHGTTSLKGGAPISETSPLRPQSPYARAKLAAESALSDLAGDGLSIAALRVPLIYGAAAPGNMRLLLKAVDLRLPLPLGRVDNRRAFAGTALIGSFIAHWLEAEQHGFEPYVLAHREQVSTTQFLQLLGAARGRTLPLVPLPGNWFAQALRVMGRPETADGLFESLELDISKALALGWEPEQSLHEGLRRAFARR